jgi:hypothetical protein
VFLLVFTSVNVAAARLQHWLEARQKANLMLVESFTATAGGVGFDRSIGEDLDRFWSHIPDARRQPLALVVGMSQNYAINEQAEGDRTIPELIDARLTAKGMRAFGLVAPNLDNEEALFYLLASTSYPETYPAAMIYGVCFDKFRNTDIRAGLQNFMRKRPELIAGWRALASRYAERFPRAAEKMQATLKQLAESGAARDEQSFERRLRANVGHVLPLVEARQPINALLLTALYDLRNWALGIKSSSKRPIIGARYDLNREFLELLAEEARARKVKLLPYVIPLNPRADSPYVAAEYSAFKHWFEQFTARHQLPFVNLEAIVPAPDWGLLEGQPDFKHFKGSGHRITAAAIVDAFEQQLSFPVARAQ